MTSNLPAYLQNLPSRNLAQTAVANVGAGNPPHLSIEGGRFTLIDAIGGTIPIQTLYVDVVIVDINDHISKIYYDPSNAYDPKNPNPSPPLCFSDNGLAPSINAGHPQAATCASCGHNVWGSKISAMGSAVKACSDQQKIAVYAPDYSEGLFLMRIPPGSFINWRSYMAKFAGAGLDPDRVITRISFAETNTLGFQSPGYITEAMVPVLAKMIEAKAADSIIGRLDKPRTAALPAPETQRSPLPAPPAAPQGTPPALPQSPLPLATQPPPAIPTPFPGGIVAPASPSNPPAQQQPPQRRRRRTQAEMQAAQAQPAAPLQQAPFRPDTAPQGQFGIVQNPPAPPPGLDLDAVFK